VTEKPTRHFTDAAESSTPGRSTTVERIVRFVLPEKPTNWGSIAVSSAFAIAALALIASFQATLGNVPLVGALGGSAVIAFGVPESAMAKARSLFGGHAVACGVGIAVTLMLPESPCAGAIGVGCALGLMRLTATTHSPAGADPLLIAVTHGAWGRAMIVLVAGLFIISVLAQLRAAVSRRAIGNR
jgi:CBS-domain-containing membrane protein